MGRKTIILLVIEALLFLGIFWGYNSHVNNQENIYKQNLIASHDSLEIYKMKNNELLYEKSLYISTEEQMRRQLNLSKKEVRDLERKVGELEMIASVGAEIRVDTIHSVKDSIIYTNNGTEHRFLYNDEWLSLKGVSKIENGSAYAKIYDIDINAPLKVGMTDDYKFFITSPNPHLNITSIEGSVMKNSNIAQKKSRWSQGISLGFGLQYGIINKEIDLGPQVGWYIQYEF